MMSLYTILGWLTVVAIFQGVKPLPPGVNYQSVRYPIADSSMEFISDLTYVDSLGKTHYQQEIFDSVFAYIESAEKYILLDVFLFNSYKGPSQWSLNELSSDLSDLLIRKKQQNPLIQIDFITDPVNTIYGGVQHPELQAMQRAGINTIVTDLTRLRDSNPLYNPIWRTFFQWFGNTSDYGFLPNAFSDKENSVTLRSYLAFLNLKANHRKVFVADYKTEMVSVVTSANPHSASADFSNIGIIVKGDVWQDIYKTEKGVASFSNASLSGGGLQATTSSKTDLQNENSIQLITEKKIQDALVHQIGSTTRGDSIKIAMFYLSNRKVVKGLLSASEAGVAIRLILDPNKDGFGFHHNGTPNRPVTKELRRKSKDDIQIRWFQTHGEQFHSKMTIIKKQQGPNIVILGSSNLTRKNLGNYNLETDILLTFNKNSTVFHEMESYFNMLWFNQGENYTVDYDVFDDSRFLKTILYRFQEFSGLSTY